MQPSAPYILHRDDRPETREPYTFTDLTSAQVATWFDIDKKDTPDPAALAYAWASVSQHIARTFPGQLLAKTPAQTGLNLMQSLLPRDPRDHNHWYEYHPVPDDALRIVKEYMPNARRDVTHKDRPIKSIYTYDGRCMYASLLKDMPVLLSAGDFIRDNESAYEGKRHAYYRVDVTIPHDWHHLGLMVALDPITRDRIYPHQPGQCFETWCNQKDIYLMQKHGWQYVIRERMLFHANANVAQPLAEYADRMGALLAAIEAKCQEEKTETRRYIRGALRNIVNHGIGCMSSEGMYKDVDVSRLETDAEPYQKNDGGIGARVYRTNTAFHNRWLMPEWAMTVWQGQRQRVTALALTHHYEDVLGIYADSIFCASDPHWPDSGKIGAIRLKGEITFKSWQRLKGKKGDSQEIAIMAKGGEK